MNLYLELSRLAKETHRTIPGYIRYVLIKHLLSIKEQEASQNPQ